MDGRILVRSLRTSPLALASSLLIVALPPPAGAAADELSSLPGCTDVAPASVRVAEVASPWKAVLDSDGVLVEHRMTLRRQGQDLTLRTGQRGFAIPMPDGRFLIGERASRGTSLVMVDTERACQVWARELDGLAYDATPQEAQGPLRLALHDPVTQRFEGELVIDAETGASEALIDGECTTSCYPNDGELDPAAFGPTVAARPVPAFSSGGWARDTTLRFRWQAGETPPDWARGDIRSGADDASTTSRARSPRFIYRSTASDGIRYTSLFPTFCQYGIACASRDMPAFWSVWLRPHGSDFSWGTLRWCQRDDGSGCFDVRRVMLHELGHVIGLNHPSSGGFQLEASETVMHDIAPAKPAAGSTRHTFGRCDVATLQELYDVPTASTPISTCNDVPTKLALSAAASSVIQGGTVRLTATLQVAVSSALGLLAGNALDERSVRLRYRRAGSTDAWTTLPMAPRSSGGRYDLVIAPESSWEFRAVFPAPNDEGLGSSSSNTVKVAVTVEQPET